METNLFFSRDSEAAFGTQSATMGGSLGRFGAKMTETNGNKLFFLGIQRQRLAPKVRPWERVLDRIRLGKAVAGPGVRGQDDRDK